MEYCFSGCSWTKNNQRGLGSCVSSGSAVIKGFCPWPLIEHPLWTRCSTKYTVGLSLHSLPCWQHFDRIVFLSVPRMHQSPFAFSLQRLCSLYLNDPLAPHFTRPFSIYPLTQVKCLFIRDFQWYPILVDFPLPLS